MTLILVLLLALWPAMASAQYVTGAPISTLSNPVTSAQGGTGGDFSASTGVLYDAAGTFSAIACASGLLQGGAPPTCTNAPSVSTSVTTPRLNATGTIIGIGGTTSSFPGLKTNGNQLQIVRADDSNYAELLTGMLTLFPVSNAVPLTISGGSTTGSGTTGMIVASHTLNTSGVVHADDRAYTVTAAGAGSTLFRIRGGVAGATAAFAVDTAGVATAVTLSATGNASLGGTPINVAGLNIADTHAIAVASARGARVVFNVGGAAGGDLFTFRTRTTELDNQTSGNSTVITSPVAFQPPSGNGNFAMVHLNPTISGTSTGTAYGLLLASKTNVLTNGTIKLASFGTTSTDGFIGYTERWGVLPDGTTTAAGHIQSSTTAPAVSNTSANSCGTTAATIVGTDVAGKVTVGATAGTSCTVTFTTAWTNAPACMVTNETTANLSRATSTTTTAILAGTFVAGDVLAYMCLGRV